MQPVNATVGGKCTRALQYSPYALTGCVPAGPGDNPAIGPPLHVIDLNPRKTGNLEFRGPALDHCRRKRPAKMRGQPDAGGTQALEKRRIGKRRAVSVGMNENTPFDGILLAQCPQIANRLRIVNTRKCNECGFQMTRQHRRQSEFAAGDEGDRNPAESRSSTPEVLELTMTPSPVTVDRQTVVTAQRPFSSSLERPGLMSMGPSSMLAKALATAMKSTGPLTHSVRRTIQATGPIIAFGLRRCYSIAEGRPTSPLTITAPAHFRAFASSQWRGQAPWGRGSTGSTGSPTPASSRPWWMSGTPPGGLLIAPKPCPAEPSAEPRTPGIRYAGYRSPPTRPGIAPRSVHRRFRGSR